MLKDNESLGVSCPKILTSYFNYFELMFRLNLICTEDLMITEI